MVTGDDAKDEPGRSVDDVRSDAVNSSIMRALPMTEQSRPGGRPRTSRAPDHAFASWLRTCGRKPAKIAKELGVTESAIYSLRNGYFKPGLELAMRIEQLTTSGKGKNQRSAVPAESWTAFVARPRPAKRAGKSSAA